MSYPIPAQENRAEMLVVNSRFIATLAPAFSVEEARTFIARLRAEFADATHNVPAYIVGHGASVITHAHDDGEPAGTAGRPAMAVLQGSGLGDAVVVVTTSPELQRERVLARGFVLVRDAKDRPVTSAAKVAAGAALRLQFADGQVPVTATGGSDRPAPASSPAPRRKPDDKQGSLL